MNHDLREAYIRLLKSSASLQWEVARQFGHFLPGRDGEDPGREQAAMERLARLMGELNADWALLMRSVGEKYQGIRAREPAADPEGVE